MTPVKLLPLSRSVTGSIIFNNDYKQIVHNLRSNMTNSGKLQIQNK